MYLAVLELKAKRGDAAAQFHLGSCFLYGIEVAKDEKVAVSWYQKAAIQGHAQAQNNLGWCYANGAGVAKDEILAVNWYEKAAAQGLSLAQNNLGVSYENGRGVTKKEKVAVNWYEKAAAQGLAIAQYNLGVCYADARGVAQDDKAAASWYEKAAVQGVSQAQCNLGWCYANGRGVAKDEKVAVDWYEKAAVQGLAIAQFNLGVCYYGGIGTAKNLVLAKQWYEKAAAQGDTESLTNLLDCHKELAEQGKTKTYTTSNNSSSNSLASSSSARSDSADQISESNIQEVLATCLIDYKVLTRETKLGKGSYGRVYKGVYNKDDVVIKELILQRMSKEAETEFKNEATTMARLQHQNTIKVFGYCISPYCIVMEWMHCSLFDVLHNNQELPWSLRLSISQDIVAGLSYLHNKGIIHRNLNSLNILLNRDMRAKLTDFGLSKLKAETKTKVSSGQNEDRMGKVQWMAPELLSSKPKYSQASDIYAYAMVLWELVTTQIPFKEALSYYIQADVKQGIREDIPEDCPKKFSSLIKFCWLQEPNKRPEAKEIAAYLCSDAEEFKPAAASANPTKEI